MPELARDQSEDRPAPRFAVVYIDGESNPRFAAMPYKVFNLSQNPSMRGVAGRASFFTAEQAVNHAVACESNPDLWN